MSESPTNRAEARPPDDVLKQAIAAIENAPALPGPPPELVNATLATLHDSDPPTIPSHPVVSRSLLMKSLAATCCLLLVAGVAVLIMTAIQPSSMAFADAVEQLRSARTLSYTRLITVEGKPDPIKTRELFAEDGRHRSEHESGVTTIFDSSSRIRLTLIEATKTALVRRPVDDNRDHLKRHFVEWLETLKKLGDQPDKKLGEKTVDGRRAVGFVATQGNRTFTIWVDAKTNQIVRIEYDSPIEGPVQQIVMTGFQFNQPLDESLFSFDVPDGYTVQEQRSVPKVPGGEESVVEALRGYTKLSGGQFPASISDWGEWAVLFSKNTDNGRPTAEATRVMSHLGSILPFLTRMTKDDYEYLGKGKTLADTDAVVFWYKTKDGTYRAVYGDLTVKAVAADDLPKE
jgi:outer membrane lipoprotein-sorting protein